jgi:hypothetical protein
MGRTRFPPFAASRRETEIVAGWRQCILCPVRAVAAQALPPYHVLHRVGAVAQLPGAMSTLPAHVKRRKLSHLDSHHHRPCVAARTHVYGGGYGTRVKHGS